MIKATFTFEPEPEEIDPNHESGLTQAAHMAWTLKVIGLGGENADFLAIAEEF